MKYFATFVYKHLTDSQWYLLEALVVILVSTYNFQIVFPSLNV